MTDDVSHPDLTDPAPERTRAGFRQFLEALADGFYESDLQGMLRFCNRALGRMLGESPAVLRGRPFRDFMDARTARRVISACGRLYRSGEIAPPLSISILRKDGQTRVLELSATLVGGPGASASGFQGIVRDVTRSIATQRELDASRQCAVDLYEVSSRTEQRYRAFLEFLPDPVFVGNLDNTVSYVNPAFEKVFGWTLRELEGRRIPFIPESDKPNTRKGVKKLFTEKVVHDFEVRRLTRDGRILDIMVDGAVLYDERQQPAGQVITLRDVTARKRAEQTSQALFRIARALYRYSQLDPMLNYITGQIRELIKVDGATVILLDEDKQEFYIPAASYADGMTGSRMREIRFPVDKGVAGYVYRTGEPMIVHDTAKSPYFYDQIDTDAQYLHRNMLDVPLRHQHRIIGVLCAVNKQEGVFDEADVERLSAVASVVALPIENARINEALQQAYENVRGLNRSKEQVINHLSHELKTPLSVLSASLGLLEKRLPTDRDAAVDRIVERMRRNLQRLLDMQYEISDMLRERHYRAHGMLSFLLAASRDMLVSLIEAGPEATGAAEIIQASIDREFGTMDAPCTRVAPDRVVQTHLERLKPVFARRRIRLEARLEPVPPVFIPVEVMEKIVEGLVRNAIENTPDQGRVTVVLRGDEKGSVLDVHDTGVGITPEKQRLIFNHYFAPGDSMTHAARAPYDFNAGGKGVDLLRITIFAERYRFGTKMVSRRCGYIPTDGDRCPGDINKCRHCHETADCYASGGTTMQIRFAAADRVAGSPPDACR